MLNLYCTGLKKRLNKLLQAISREKKKLTFVNLKICWLLLGFPRKSFFTFDEIEFQTKFHSDFVKFHCWNRNFDLCFDVEIRILIFISTSEFRFWFWFWFQFQNQNFGSDIRVPYSVPYFNINVKFQSIFHRNKSAFLFCFLIRISIPTVKIKIEIPIIFDN
jgi:hypothetical protein